MKIFNKIKYALLIIPSLVLAEGEIKGFTVPGSGATPTVDYGHVKTTTTIPVLITRGLTFLFWTVGLVSLVFLLIGAFTYVTSQGNEDSIDKAKKTILYAIIGVVVALLAIVVLNYLKSTLETGAVPTL